MFVSTGITTCQIGGVEWLDLDKLLPAGDKMELEIKDIVGEGVDVVWEMTEDYGFCMLSKKL